MTLYRQGGIWYYDFTVRGKRHAGSTGEKSKSKAQVVHDRLRLQFRDNASIRQVWEQTKSALLGQGESIQMELASVWKHFLAHGMSHAGQKRMDIYRGIFKDFCEWLAEKHGKISAGEVTPAIATEYITELRNRPGAPASKNEKLMVLKMLFSSFDESAGVVENPFAKIKRLPHSGVSREVFTQEELKLIAEKATGDVLDLCLTALYTGLRRGDVCTLRRSAISPDYAWIHLVMNKTGRPVDIPIMPRLKEHLQLRLAEGNSEFVYPHLQKLYTEKPIEISRMIKEFFAEIGLQGIYKKTDGYAHLSSVKDVHSFRHTFVYLAACNNIPLPIVQSIVGHTSPAMTKIYMNHANKADKQRYIATLPDFLSGQERKTPVQAIIEMVENDAPKEEILSALRAL